MIFSDIIGHFKFLEMFFNTQKEAGNIFLLLLATHTHTHTHCQNFIQVDLQKDNKISVELFTFLYERTMKPVLPMTGNCYSH